MLARKFQTSAQKIKHCQPMTRLLDAIVLLGPTGSGKTPLGQFFEMQSTDEIRFVHFDFGENLRQVVACGRPDDRVTDSDIAFLRRVLETGALLEDKDFPIAMRILQSFLVRRQVTDTTTVVLNGLPRHIGQASSLASLLDVRRVVLLRCSPEVVQQRIANNAGGDRADRTDDQLAAIQNKLNLYQQRTIPLVEHYRVQGADIVPVEVTATMTAAEMWQLL